MDAGDWRGIFTIVMFLMFIGICIWAYSRKRKQDFDEAAQLPLHDDWATSSGAKDVKPIRGELEK
jgi:cytochrome c oxidase cbb3-type subunit 4